MGESFAAAEGGGAAGVTSALVIIPALMVISSGLRVSCFMFLFICTVVCSLKLKRLGLYMTYSFYLFVLGISMIHFTISESCSL